jgi:hypothetical protein
MPDPIPGFDVSPLLPVSTPDSLLDTLPASPPSLITPPALRASPGPVPAGASTPYQSALDRYVSMVQGAQQPPATAMNGKLMAVLPGILAFAMKNAGVGGAAALLGGISQAREQRAKEVFTKQHDDFMRQGDIVSALRLQQQEQERQAQEQKQRELKQQGWLQDVRDILDKSTSGTEFDQHLADARSVAPTIGLDGATVDQLVNRREGVLQKTRQKRIQDALDRAAKNPTYRNLLGTPQFDSMVLQVPGEDPISVGDARRLVGDYLLDRSGRQVNVGSSAVTFGDLFPNGKNTRMASQPVPTKPDGQVDMDAATLAAQRMGWLPKEKPGESANEARLAKKDAIAEARDNLRLAVKAGKGMRPWLSKLRQLGQDSTLEMQRAADAISRESLASARAQDAVGPSADYSTPDDVLAGAQRELAQEDQAAAPPGVARPGAPRPSQPTPAARPAGPPASLSNGVTTDELSAMATRMGKTYAQVEAMAKSRGLTITGKRPAVP